ncbi:MAG: TolC family protein [Bacteroidetes bacterium]|nr:TolC family protein [Bacteroidota bacterium]MCW5896523.1 TolC family protein [Bacteroidota bacterium]
MKKLFFILLVFVGITTAQAQQTIELTVERAITLALDNSKALHASLMRLNYADAKSSEVNTSRLPNLKFVGGYTRLSDVPPFAVTLPQQLGGNSFTLAPSVLNNYAMKVSLEQPLFAGFKLSAVSAAADYSAKASEQEFARSKSDLIYNTRAAYWNLFKARELKKVTDENVEQVKAHLKDVEFMLQQGMATTSDVLNVQVQLSDAQLRQIEANNNVQLAMISLNNTIGIPLQTNIVIDSDINHTTQATYTNLNSIIGKAMDARPELKAMEYRVKATEAGVTAAKAGWWPQIFLSANYNYNRPNQRIQPAQDIFKDTWDVTLGVSLDIWNWGKTLHQTDQASAQYEEAKDGFAQVRDQVTLEITQAFLNLNQAKERTVVAEKGVQQAQESYRVTNNRFKEGLAQNSDMLDAEVALLTAKTKYTQALVDHELAEAWLLRAIGG